ncbi:hypothetical protein SASPL_137089 [Salvia splendens]|uniref:Multidrug resistance protein, MATE family n=1 Tax=Salvia splendens TaxID=180675 RepID=A0A8X8WT26_SALSN|nr:hypothetical protein SASPL_137089 [Salvia splendens]
MEVVNSNPNQPLLLPVRLRPPGCAKEAWGELKKLWQIAAPSIFCRLAMFSLTIITQSLAGHLAQNQLAAISIVTTVLISITVGFLLGMASVLEMLCGQAYGGKQYHLLAIYLQRSWVVLSLSSVALLPLFVFLEPMLKLVGQPAPLAELAGQVALWMIPMADHSDEVLAVPVEHVRCCLGLWRGACSTRGNNVCGWCPSSWTGFSREAFDDLWDFFKLSLASGVMLALENFYFRMLVLISSIKGAEVAVDALSICMSFYGWESMIPMGLYAATGYVELFSMIRVACEIGAGNENSAKLAAKVSVLNSLLIGFLFFVIIMAFPDKIAMIFVSSSSVISMVEELASLLAITILFNCIQPILSGVAVGSGWQVLVAYISIGSYYIIGLGHMGRDDLWDDSLDADTVHRHG